jgi:hypothetical protein
LSDDMPEIKIVQGYWVVCTNERCNPEEPIAFSEKEEDAKKILEVHKEVHQAHLNRLKELLGEPVTPSPATHVQVPRGLQCPTCFAEVGQRHTRACDVAVCLENGGQRALRDHVPPFERHEDCGQDVWTGFFPGEKEAAEYGVPMNVMKQLGRWDKERRRWVMEDGWYQKMQELGLGPRIS